MFREQLRLQFGTILSTPFRLLTIAPLSVLSACVCLETKMLCIKWLEGESNGFTDILPDSVLSPGPPAVIVHNVRGPRAGNKIAKCGVSHTGTDIDLDYEAFASFNRSQNMLLGIMRVITRDGEPIEVHWKSLEEKKFRPVEVKIDFKLGLSLIQFDLNEIKKRVENPTERLQFINARIGQGEFRAKLHMRWNGECALTKIANDMILRASHIKPWAECERNERLDPNNGLLLAAHVDALFDQHLITFGEEGQLIWSSRVSVSDRNALALPKKLCLNLRAEEKRYLMHHNRVFFEK